MCKVKVEAMPVGVEVGRIARLEEQWGHAVADANGGGALDAETEVATVRSLCIISELAQTPAANVTDVAAVGRHGKMAP